MRVRCQRAWAWFQGALSGLLNFVSQIPTLFVQALRSLELIDIVLLPRTFIRFGSVFANFAGQFITWAGEQVFSLLQIIFEVLAPLAMPYIRRAASALRTIFRDPIGFIGNLVRAGIQGFRQFGSHFADAPARFAYRLAHGRDEWREYLHPAGI